MEVMFRLHASAVEVHLHDYGGVFRGFYGQHAMDGPRRAILSVYMDIKSSKIGWGETCHRFCWRYKAEDRMICAQTGGEQLERAQSLVGVARDGERQSLEVEPCFGDGGQGVS